jgi:hypothetical protein
MSMWRGEPTKSVQELLDAIKTEAVRGGGTNGNLTYLIWYYPYKAQSPHSILALFIFFCLDRQIFAAIPLLLRTMSVASLVAASDDCVGLTCVSITCVGLTCVGLTCVWLTCVDTTF